MTRRGPWGAAAVVLAALLALGSGGPGGCSSQHDAAPPAVPLPRGTGGMPVRGQQSDAIPMHAALRPGHALLGERVLYRGTVWVPIGTRVDWIVPPSGGALTWGPIRAGNARAWPLDSAWIEVPLQAFQTGVLSIPGLEFRVPSRPWLARGATRGRLPMTRLAVAPTLGASDSAADLRPVRGPLAAPWWERIVWPYVALLALALATVVILIWWLRRPKRVVTPARVPAPRVLSDPTSEALAALAALRALHLPEHGRFAEHAFQLTRILRRYLERRIGALEPGDTSGELVLRLASARGRLDADSLQIVEKLLRGWDRVKFARAATDAKQAAASERAVEGLVRRQSAPAEAAA